MSIDTFLLSVESRDLSQVEKSNIRVSSFSVSQQLRLDFSSEWLLSILSDLSLIRRTKKCLLFNVANAWMIRWNLLFEQNCKDGLEPPTLKSNDQFVAFQCIPLPQSCFALTTLKYESEAISLVVNGSCFSSKTLQMVGYESGKKRGLQSSFYLSLSLSLFAPKNPTSFPISSSNCHVIPSWIQLRSSINFS